MPTLAVSWLLAALLGADPVYEWPQYKGDAGLSGVSPDSSVRPPLKLLWSFRLDGDASGDAGAGVTVGGGLVFVNVHNTRSIVALDAHTGQFVWEYADSAIGYKTVPSYAEGRLILWERYFKSNRVVALDARTGKPLWQRPLANPEIRSAHRAGLPVANGKVYCSEGGEEPAVLALDAATGKDLWRVTVGKEHGPVITPPTVAGGKVFVGVSNSLGFRLGESGAVLALDADSGKPLWRKPGLFPYKALPTDGQVLVCAMFGKNDQKSYLLHAQTGEVIWSGPNRHHYPQPTVLADRILIPSYGGDFVCYDRQSGKPLWQFSSPTRSGCSSPVVSGDYAYIGSGVVAPGDTESIASFQRIDAPREKGQGGTLFAVDLKTGKPVWHFSTGNTVCGDPAIAYGRLYFHSRDGRVYCFVPARNGEPTRPEARDRSPAATPEVVEKLLQEASAVPAGSWPMAGGNPQRGGLPGVTPSLPLEPAWSFDSGGRVLTAAAIADGRVYVGSDGGKLTALSATGKKLWESAAGAPIRCSPAVAGGLVYCGADSGVFRALDAVSGKEQWRFEAGGPVQASPAVVGGVVFFGANDHHVYALDRHSGKKLWACRLNDYRIQAPPVVHGDTVYVGQYTDWVWALDRKTGQPKWKSFIPVAIEHVAFHRDMVYARSPYYVVEIDPADGKRLRIAYASGGYGGLACAGDRIVNAGVQGQYGGQGAAVIDLADPGKPLSREIPTLEGVRLLTSKSLKGAGDTGSMVAPLLLGDLLCIASRQGNLLITDLDGTVRWKHSLPAGCHSPPVAAGGLLVVGCDDGKFYAFREKAR